MCYNKINSACKEEVTKVGRSAEKKKEKKRKKYYEHQTYKERKGGREGRERGEGERGRREGKERGKKSNFLYRGETRRGSCMHLMSSKDWYSMNTKMTLYTTHEPITKRQKAGCGRCITPSGMKKSEYSKKKPIARAKSYM